MSVDLQMDYSDQDKVAREPSSALLLDLIDQQGVVALLVDTRTLQLVWTSAASASLDKRLVAGNSLSDIPELQKALQEFFQEEGQGTSVKDADTHINVSVHCTLQPSIQTSSVVAPSSLASDQADKSGAIGLSVPSSADAFDHEAAGGTHVCLRSVGQQGPHLMLKIEPEQQLDNYYRQYVADRDKLFNTSRALTVNEMATTLAHELNQPIGTVVNLMHGCIERLQDHNDSHADQTEAQVDTDVLDALDFGIRQSQFASQIIARVRDFTEARQPSMERRDIRVLIQDSVKLLDWVFASERIDLTLDVGHTPLIVACDGMLLQQVMVNLCRNAIEAIREIQHGERRLNVLSYRSSDGVHVEIADTGPGMDDTSLTGMFKPFVTSKRNGMGIGLNICRSFVELHQGKLWVTRNECQGCTVHIRLPEARMEASAVRPEVHQ